MQNRIALSFLACASMLISTCALAVVVPDNGSGTAHMPLHTSYGQESLMYIINGLPPGTTMELDGYLSGPAGTSEVPGGTLGGTKATATGMAFVWNLQGTGTLAGFNRPVLMPLSNQEVHTAPRVPFAPVQSFNTDMYFLQGQLPPGDPDFDLLRFTAGSGFGMPSPGHTTLFQSGPNWAVDSFFDITYRIDFVGHPGSPLSGMSGSTTSTVRISVPEPLSASLIAPAALLLMRRRRSA